MTRFASIEKICPICNTPFYAQPNELARGAGVYCSNPCRHRGRTRSLADRLWEKVDRSGGEDACWLYTTIAAETYGLIYDPDAANVSKIIGTHVAAYQITYGPVPPGKCVLHKCPSKANKRCCNPRHLALGDASENAHDAIAEGAWIGNKRLTDEEVYAIRCMHGRYSQKELAHQFGVAQTNISDIIHGKIHRTIGGPLKQGTHKQKTHCHKGHALTEDNIVLSRSGTQRNCAICYTATQERKEAKRRAAVAARANTPRAQRHDSWRVRLPSATIAAIRADHATLSYRALVKKYALSYGTIQHILLDT